MTTRGPKAAEFRAARKLGEGSRALNACPMDGGRLLPRGDGAFDAVWQRDGSVYYSSRGDRERELGRGKQPVAILQQGEPLIVWQQGAAFVGLRGTSGGVPDIHASDGRFPVLVSLSNGYGALVAYEQGPAKAPRIVVERLEAGSDSQVSRAGGTRDRRCLFAGFWAKKRGSLALLLRKVVTYLRRFVARLAFYSHRDCGD